MSTINWMPTTAHMLNDAPGTIVVGSPGSGKAIWDDEKIVTPEGMKQIKDIKIGDLIFGKNGMPTKVTGVFPQGKMSQYKITFADGRSLICNNEHRFTVGRVNHGEVVYRVYTVQELIDAQIKRPNGRSKFFIQNNDCIQYPEQNFKVHPYILGVFLGDGVKTATGCLTLSAQTDETPKKVRKLLEKSLGKSIGLYKNPANYSFSFYYKGEKMPNGDNKLVHASDLDEELSELLTNCYAQDKYIPDSYKYCSEKQRYALIQGLMDTDGTIGVAPKCTISYCTTSETLKNDIIEVIRSLGNMYVSERGVDTRKDSPCYSVTIGCDAKRKAKLFSISNKVERAKQAGEVRRNYETLRIIDIQDIHKKYDCTCFTVDADDHQFIAGDTVVTHNTFACMNFAANCLGMGQRVVVLDPKNDFNRLYNVNPNIELIDLRNAADGALNPFEFLKKENEDGTIQYVDAATIMTIIEILVGTGKMDGKTYTKITPIIQDFCKKVRLEDAYADLNDVATYLLSRDNNEAQTVASMLNLFKDNDFYKLLCSRNESKPLKLSDTASMVITLFGLPMPDYNKKPEDYDANERLTSAIIYIVTSKLLEILQKEHIIPCTLFCDEAHLLFSNPQMAGVIDKFLTLGRSLNCATVLASQGISHFPDGIANYITSKFMFKSSADEAELFLEKFIDKDSAYGMDLGSIVSSVTNLPKGCCFFMDRKNRNGIIRIESIYDVDKLTSNPFKKQKVETAEQKEASEAG
jgi:hypothetical protein